MGRIIDIAALRDAKARPPAKGSPGPSNDVDGMLHAVSAVLKADTLDDDLRWRLIGTIMQSLEQRRRR